MKRVLCFLLSFLSVPGQAHEVRPAYLELNETGEAHPCLSPNDEFADFEPWDKGNLDGSVVKKAG